MPNNINTESEMNFIDSLFSLDLRQVNSVFNSLHRILDLIFVSADLKCSVADCAFPISPPNTHHSGLVIDIEFYEFDIISNYEVYQYNYNSCDFNYINMLLNNVDWCKVLDSEIVSINYEEFLKIVNNIFKANIKNVSPKVSKFPWYTRGLKRLKNLRNKYHRQFKAGNRANDGQLCDHYTREFNFLNKFLYNQYILGYEQSIKSNPRRFWTFIQSRCSSSTVPSTMTYNGAVGNSLFDTASMFKLFFSQIFQQIPIILMIPHLIIFYPV